MLLVNIQLHLAGQIKEKRSGHKHTTQWRRKSCNHLEKNKKLGENATYNVMTRITGFSLLFFFLIIDKFVDFMYLGSYTSFQFGILSFSLIK